jgi:hypothetical protein
MAMSPRLLRPLATGFNPKSISGLALWLDGADSSSLYTTSEGPVAPVSSPLDISGCVGWWDASDASTLTLDGSGNVEAWADKTSEGNDLTQATPANRPSVTAAAVNGLPAVTFDGSNDTLRTGAISLTQPFQYYLVFRFESAYTSGAPRIIDAGTQPSPGRSGEFFRQGADDARLYSGSTVVGSSVPAGQLEQFNLWSISSGGASDSFIRYKGGEYQVSTTAGTGAGSRITLGGDSNATAASHSNISVAELVLVSGALSAAERASLERYFAIKYGFATVHAPATAASDPVGYWRDRSGNGRHATQSTAASRPTIGSQNGRRALSANGTSHDMALTNAGGVTRNAPGVTIIAALSPNTVASIRSAVLFSIGTSAAARTLLQFNGAELRAGGRRLDVDSFDSATGGTIVANQPIVAVARLDYANANAVAYSNSAPLATDTSFLTAGLVSDTASQASSIMNSSGGFFFYSGIFAELLVYNRALTDAERRKAEIYLARKWGTTLAPQVSNADAQDWVNRVYANGGTVSTSTANAVNTFCASIDAAGIRDRFYRLNLFAGTGLNAALVPLYSGPSRTGTQGGLTTDSNNGPFVSGDYSETAGLTGNGSTKHLRIGTLQSVYQGVPATGHMAVWSSPLASGTRRAIGIFDLTLQAGQPYPMGYIVGIGATAQMEFGRVNGMLRATPAASALLLLNRSSTSSVAFYENSTSVLTNSSASINRDIPDASISVFGQSYYNWNNNSFNHGYEAPSTTFSSYSCGASMTGAQVTDYHNALVAFRTAMGRT